MPWTDFRENQTAIIKLVRESGWFTPVMLNELMIAQSTQYFLFQEQGSA